MQAYAVSVRRSGGALPEIHETLVQIRPVHCSGLYLGLLSAVYMKSEPDLRAQAVRIRLLSHLPLGLLQASALAPLFILIP